MHEDNLRSKPQYKFTKKLSNGLCVLPMSAIRFLDGVDGISVRTEHDIEMLEIELKNTVQSQQSEENEQSEEQVEEQPEEEVVDQVDESESGVKSEEDSEDDVKEKIKEEV